MIASAGNIGQQISTPGGNMLQYNKNVVGGALSSLSPSVFGASAVPVVPVVPGAAPLKGGNQSQSKKGGEILTDLAVPALFLVSRNAINSSRKNRSSKSIRKSVRGGNQSRKHKKTRR